MEAKIEEVASILVKSLNITTLKPEHVKIQRMIGFSNEVYKVVISDDIKCPHLKSNTMMLKQKINEKPNADYILLGKEVPEFLKKHRFGALNIFEDEDIVIEEFIPSTTCKRDDFKNAECFFQVLRQVAEYGKLFKDHADELQVHNVGKTLISIIIEKGIVEKSIQNLKKVLGSENSTVNKNDVLRILNWIEKEALTDDVKKVIDEANKLPLMVCHNDFYWLNVLNKDEGGYLLIDYEYTAFNPIGWDIANYYTERNFHFDEKANVFTYYKNLPGIGERSLVYKYYLLCLDDKFDHNTPVDTQLMFDLAQGKYDSMIDLDLLDRLVDHASFVKLLLMVNLQWIYFNCVMLDDDPTWPIIQYTFYRIELHMYLIKALESHGDHPPANDRRISI